MIYNVIYTPIEMEAIKVMDVLNYRRIQNQMPVFGGSATTDKPIVLPDWLLKAIEQNRIVVSESSIQKTTTSTKYVKTFADKDDWIVREGTWINLYSDKAFRDKFKIVK